MKVTPIPKPGKKVKKKRPGFKGKASPYCQVCGTNAGGGVRIERHHIVKRSQGGTDAPQNRIDLCAGPGSLHCHLKAHQGQIGFAVDELRAKKQEAEAREERIGKVFG